MRLSNRNFSLFTPRNQIRPCVRYWGSMVLMDGDCGIMGYCANIVGMGIAQHIGMGIAGCGGIVEVAELRGKAKNFKNSACNVWGF